jgi:aryl-alcohol dehydrogenase-like predicted oxidoreductase
VALGSTGLRVSRIGFGGSYGAPAEAYEYAFHEHGVNFLYWGSIRRPGMRDAIRRLVAGGHRDRLVVALQSYDRTGFLMRPFVARGLAALGLDHADLLILGYHDAVPAARVQNAANRLVDAGLVRYLAMSGHARETHGVLAADPARPFDALMFRYNAAHRGAESEILPRLPDRGRPGTIGYTATRWGQLLDARKMPPGEAPLSASTCYRFVLSQPRIDLCLAGPSSAEHVREACRALALGPLDTEELARVRRIGDLVHGGR